MSFSYTEPLQKHESKYFECFECVVDPAEEIKHTDFTEIHRDEHTYILFVHCI